MQKIDAGRLCGALAGLSAWHQSLSDFPTPSVLSTPVAYLISGTDRDRILRDVAIVTEQCISLELTVALSKLEVLKNLLDSPSDAPSPPGATEKGAVSLSQGRVMEARKCVEQVLYIIPPELSAKFVLVVSAERSEYLTNKEPFGPEVCAKLPSAARDVSEAASCIAFGRCTASVMHLMRALEYSLRATAACLGVPEPKSPNWSQWLSAIKTGIATRGTQGKWTDRDLFQDIYNRLDAIKDAVRNASMHAEREFTEQEAIDCFRATRSFMQRVASRMDEKGNPRL